MVLVPMETVKILKTESDDFTMRSSVNLELELGAEAKARGVNMLQVGTYAGRHITRK